MGVAQLLAKGGRVDPGKISLLLDDDELKQLTTGATNSLLKLSARIELVSSRAGG